MSAKFFLDTNVLVYAFDKREPTKQRKAKRLITRALQGEGFISYKVAQEFLNVATTKFKNPLTEPEARRVVGTLIEPLCSVFASLALFNDALGIQAETGYGFYDSLIVAGALEGNAKVLYSEDMQDGRQVRGLRIENPFRS